MALHLINSNVVVSAHQFNPSITDEVWLIENEIVQRDECESGFVFTDMFAQVQTPRFHLLIVPDRCQFTLAPDTEGQQDLILERIGKFITLLPHTPYQAVGLNFLWHLIPEGLSIEQLSRKLFYLHDQPLYQYFDAEDARFGAYLSKNLLDFRLKVDIKPVLFTPPSGEEINLIQFSFNFHKDIINTKDRVAEIEMALKQWNEVQQESSKIMELILKGQ